MFSYLANHGIENVQVEGAGAARSVIVRIRRVYEVAGARGAGREATVHCRGRNNVKVNY